MLPREAGALAEREVALLAAEPPHDVAVLLRDLVDGPGVTRRDEQVAVGVDVDRVDVEVVEEVADAGVGLGRRHVVEAAPLEQHLRARNLELLDDPLHDLLRAAALAGLREVDGAQVPGGHERRPVGREEELVQVGRLPAAGREPRDLAVGLVEDHVVAVAEPVLGLPLPPGQHRLALVESGLEVRRRLCGVGWNHTGSPSSSRISAPRWPGPDDGAMKMRPGAVPAAGWRTVTFGGCRSGRDTK